MTFVRLFSFPSNQRVNLRTRTKMASRFRPPALLLLLSIVFSLYDVTRSQGCPEGCNCFGSFVACHQFTADKLSRLPSYAETLVLSSGNISSFPPGFVKQFPQLTFLEIQNTQVETIAEDTFSGVAGFDQMALTDCRFGSIEAGAFSELSAVSQFLMSGCQVGTIHTRAFSSLHNVGEFSIWSTTIDTVEPRAFSNLSDFHSFAFYLNNVTTLASDAFQAVKNFGKVDVYLNRFTSMQGGAVAPLTAATSDMNLYSNVFACDCSIAQTFHSPLLSRFLMSQKCLMPGSEVPHRLSEVPLSQMCTEAELTQQSTKTPGGNPYPVSTAKPDLGVSTSSSSQAVKDPNQGLSSPRSHGTTTPSVPTPTSSDVTSQKWASTEGTHSGKGQNSGELSQDGAAGLGSGVGTATQVSLVSFLATVTTTWIVSVV